MKKLIPFLFVILFGGCVGNGTFKNENHCTSIRSVYQDMSTTVSVIKIDSSEYVIASTPNGIAITKHK